MLLRTLWTERENEKRGLTHYIIDYIVLYAITTTKCISALLANIVKYNISALKQSFHQIAGVREDNVVKPSLMRLVQCY